ncbi:hypothetical protein NLX62_02420 [Mycobacteriaceae bacterium Msp059]|nr:hypothetical protein [Mycobacteriaceae bacterium Msp059]
MTRIEQDQSGGAGAANLQAAGSITGNTIIQNTYGVSEQRVREIAIELWQNNAPRLAQEANATHNNRAIKMTSEVITRATARDPELLERFVDPRAQVALLKAQEAYGETGDDELGKILAGLVVDLVSESPRTRREIVLREAIECAPRLTSQHLAALSVIVELKNMRYRWARDVGGLLESFDRDFRPFYDRIPTDAFEYGYMGATAAGSYLPGLGNTAYDAVFNGHPNAMYAPFPIEDVPDEWVPDEASGKELSAMLWLLNSEQVEKRRIKLAPDAADVVLRANPDATPPLTEMQKNLRQFLKDRSIDAGAFKAHLRESYPELAAFFDVIDSTLALHFTPSPVGSMLARHEMATRSPETAAEMDKLFTKD